METNNLIRKNPALGFHSRKQLDLSKLKRDSDQPQKLDHRFVESVTLSKPSDNMQTVEASNESALPVKSAKFRRGFSLTAEKTGLRVAGSVGGFLPGVSMSLSESGLHLSNSSLTQTLGAEGVQEFASSKEADSKILVSPTGGVLACFSDHSGTGTVNLLGHVQTDNSYTEPFLPLDRINYIRAKDAQDIASEAMAQASDLQQQHSIGHSLKKAATREAGKAGVKPAAARHYKKGLDASSEHAHFGSKAMAFARRADASTQGEEMNQQELGELEKDALTSMVFGQKSSSHWEDVKSEFLKSIELSRGGEL